MCSLENSIFNDHKVIDTVGFEHKPYAIWEFYNYIFSDFDLRHPERSYPIPWILRNYTSNSCNDTCKSLMDCFVETSCVFFVFSGKMKVHQMPPANRIAPR